VDYDAGMKTLLSGTLAFLLSFVSVAVSAFADNVKSATTPDAQSHMIKITDKGLEPATLEMRKEDRITFFVNDSVESLVTLDLNFGKHSTHCSSGNLKIGDDGVIRSVKPIGPKDFATTCFHDPGSYSFTIYGVKNAPRGLKGTIIVK